MRLSPVFRCAVCLTISIVLSASILAADEPPIGVTDASEFVKNIRSNTLLHLKAVEYDLSSVSGRGSGNVYWEKVGDGTQLVIHNVEGLQIIGYGEELIKLTARPRQAHVLVFRNCRGIRLVNLEICHAPVSDNAAVLRFENCGDIEITGCVLSGGSEGLALSAVDTLKFTSSQIRACGNGIMTLVDSKELEFNKARFFENKGGNFINIRSCQDVVFTQTEIDDNISLPGVREPSLFVISGGSAVELRDSRILHNEALIFSRTGQEARMSGCTDKDNIAPVTAPANGASAPIVVSPDGRGDYKTIGKAISNAVSGAKILVKSGIYRESLVIDKELELVGDSQDGIAIVESDDSACLQLKATKAAVRSLTFRRVAGQGDNFAVEVVQGSPQIEHCDITSDSSACLAVHGRTSAPVVRNCRIHDGNQDGMFFYDSAAGTIEDCDVYGNTYSGIDLRGGCSPTTRKCRIYDNKQSGVDYQEKGTGGLLEDCDVFGNYNGVNVINSANPTINRCRIHDNRGYGANITSGAAVSVQGCTLSGNSLGAWNIVASSVEDRGGNIPPYKKEEPASTNKTQPAAEGDGLFHDDFSNPKSGWSASEAYSYKDGEYEIKVPQRYYVYWTTGPIKLPNNYMVQVDARLIEGLINGRYGIIFNVTDTAWYMFALTLMTANTWFGRIKDRENGRNWYLPHKVHTLKVIGQAIS